jgi:hypothetical protein
VLSAFTWNFLRCAGVRRFLGPIDYLVPTGVSGDRASYPDAVSRARCFQDYGLGWPGIVVGVGWAFETLLDREWSIC